MGWKPNPPPTDLLYRSRREAELPSTVERKKFRKRLADLDSNYDGPILPGQYWYLNVDPRYSGNWEVVRVSAGGVVELRGMQGAFTDYSKVSWYTGPEELTKLGRMLTYMGEGVISDTSGSGDTPETGSVG